MLRTQISEALKDSMRAKEGRATSTLRLILAALKDRDIAARGKGKEEPIDDDELVLLLQSMIKQRHDSITAYTKGGRQDLADGEAEEITIIERFLPEQMSDDDIAGAVDAVIEECEASSLKQMGQVMAALRERHAGSMDFSKASQLVKAKLA
jgi:uncharacterized protein YqeY